MIVLPIPFNVIWGFSCHQHHYQHSMDSQSHILLWICVCVCVCVCLSVRNQSYFKGKRHKTTPLYHYRLSNDNLVRLVRSVGCEYIPITLKLYPTNKKREERRSESKWWPSHDSVEYLVVWYTLSHLNIDQFKWIFSSRDIVDNSGSNVWLNERKKEQKQISQIVYILLFSSFHSRLQFELNWTL